MIQIYVTFPSLLRKFIYLIFNLLQDNEQLIEEKQLMLLELVKKMVEGSKNTEFLISLRCTEVTDKDTIQKLLLILLEKVDFKVCLR